MQFHNQCLKQNLNDYEFTQEEIYLIGTHLDNEIEDLNHYIAHEKCIRLRKQTRQKRTELCINGT